MGYLEGPRAGHVWDLKLLGLVPPRLKLGWFKTRLTMVYGLFVVDISIYS